MKFNQFKLPKNEFGFTLCRYQNGQLTRGPVATGDPMSVNIPVSCPPHSKLAGLYHTHPGGIAKPSDTDIRSAKKVGAEVLCISDDRQTVCHIVK